MSINTKYHHGFSMITAIFMIVMMSTVAMLVMNLSANMSSSTTVQYQREQAMLLAKSYTEYSIMTVMSNDRINNQCIDTIIANNVIPNGAGAGVNPYTVTVNIGYIGAVPLIGQVGDANICTQISKLGNTGNDAVGTPIDELNIILDIYVTYNDYNTNRLMTYHRRTLQKI